MSQSPAAWPFLGASSYWRSGRWTTPKTTSRSCPRMNITSPTHSTSRCTGRVLEGGCSELTGWQVDEAEARDRSRGRLGVLRPGPRDDLAHFSRAAFRHRHTDGGGGGRRSERDHDVEGHDPHRGARLRPQ